MRIGTFLSFSNFLLIMLICVSTTQASIIDLKVTEIMYHPIPGNGQNEKELEFIEF